MATPEQKRAVVDGYIAAFEAGNPQAVINLFDAEATVEDPIGTPIKHGHAEILDFYTTSMATGAKLELLGPPRFAGDYVAFPFAVKLEWGGQKSVIEVIDTFRLNEAGKITEMRAFWGPENMKAV